MLMTEKQIRAMGTAKFDEANFKSVYDAYVKFGPTIGFGRPHRDVQYYAQFLHESGNFKYDREIWGNTPAQQRYDTRTDLGNTPQRDGDGKKYAGHTAGQITGKANTRDFRDWCRTTFPDQVVPDFVKTPELMNTDPWEGLGPLWFWSTKNLNKYADQGDIEMITLRVNGGRNGLDERISFYVRGSLILLGYPVTGVTYPKSAVLKFQNDNKLEADGVAGQKTRTALHLKLLAL